MKKDDNVLIGYVGERQQKLEERWITTGQALTFLGLIIWTFADTHRYNNRPYFRGTDDSARETFKKVKEHLDSCTK